MTRRLGLTPALINNNVKKNHCSFIVLVGDKSRDQVRRKRPPTKNAAKPQIDRNLHFLLSQASGKGLREPNEKNSFEIFVVVTDIRYTCAVTPNLLARTIETVKGGGLIDVYARYRTASHGSVVARFNERFILSLGSCDDCLFLDDELNVLPVSRGKDITPLEDDALPKTTPDQTQLATLRESLVDTTPAGTLVTLAKTLDQAQAVLTFIKAISEKTLSSTVTLTAALGRGKSAALDLAIAAALGHGYSNIFVTSPSPENLKTVFAFIFMGMDVLEYEEYLDYDIMQSVSMEGGSKGAIVRVDVFKAHRQTIQYIQPQDAHVLGQAEPVVIDEAAAIPLPLVQNLIGPYLVFLASTVNGYEGTGRTKGEHTTLTIQSTGRLCSDDESAPSSSKKEHPKPAPKVRSLREIKLITPIRYGTDDNIEKWLYNVLCLNATTTSSSHRGTPHPSTCSLFYVDRDTLFSYHPASEVFLQCMMALYVASHYKNRPNDLQLLSDAPAHHLFVLLPPIQDDEDTLPQPLVVLQVALEGGLKKEVVLDAAGRGQQASGDMIPWVVSTQFLESGFALLKGGRVVRVASDPDYVGLMGYSSRALEALNTFYSREYYNLDQKRQHRHIPNLVALTSYTATTDLHPETPSVRPVSSIPPYGLTLQLLRFWNTLYLRQIPSKLTGEHSCVMVRGLNSAADSQEWLGEFAKGARFVSLLSYKFREFGSVTANNMRTFGLGYRVRHAILDLIPTITTLFFERRLIGAGEDDNVHLSVVQSTILLGLGLQHKDIDDIEKELTLLSSQTLALFGKLVRKITKHWEYFCPTSIYEESRVSGRTDAV
ncbi:helicase-domain-containing protein [Mycena amicta]|nr:helicase-domain-containing protein [Mycena amicta]